MYLDEVAHYEPPFQDLHSLQIQLLSSLDLVLGELTLIFIGCSGPVVIKLFSCSAQLSMNFFLLIDVKIPTTE